MSKHRIRSRKKRIRIIKRIRRGIIAGTMLAGVAAVTFISWKAIAPEINRKAERENVVQTGQKAAEIHIETERAEETPHTYKDVDFVPLPVPMADDLAKLGFSDLYDLEQNVSAGAYILQDLFAKYEGDTTFVLMAYNAGERGARKMRESGIYETEYTVEILERAEAFSSYIDNAATNRTDVR